MSTGFTSWEVGRMSSIGSAISQLSWLVAVWETWQGLAYWCDQVSKISNDLFFWLELTCSISAFSSGYFSATNKPFQSSLVPLFQNQSKCETFHMKMSSACSFIRKQMKVIFITMAQGNWEMAYSLSLLLLLLSLLLLLLLLLIAQEKWYYPRSSDITHE